MSDTDHLLYLYGIVPADAPDPPEDLAGMEGGAVRVLRGEGPAAVVGPVPAAQYADEALDARLSDLAWVGERGLAHERVLEWFADRGPVVPLSLFSLHRDEARVRERVLAGAERFEALLRELRGRREWGVKLWRRDAELTQHIDALSPLLRQLSQEIEQAPPGRRFLLTKKRDAARGDELRSLSRRVAHRAHASLAEGAVRAHAVPLPAGGPESGRVLLLDGAYLVGDDAFPAFQQRVSQLAHEFGGVGFEFEFTGPWPPYHFTRADAT